MPYADERLIDQYRRADLQVIVDGREIRTLLREEHRRVWSGDALREVEHAHAVEST